MGNSHMQFKLLWGPFKIASIFFVINLMHQLTWHASSHVCEYCHDIDCCSLLVVAFLLLVRRRRWDGRDFRLPFRGVCPVLGYWVSRQVFTHLNHCYRFSLDTFLSVVYTTSLDTMLVSRSYHLLPCNHHISMPPLL